MSTTLPNWPNHCGRGSELRHVAPDDTGDVAWNGSHPSPVTALSGEKQPTAPPRPRRALPRASPCRYVSSRAGSMPCSSGSPSGRTSGSRSRSTSRRTTSTRTTTSPPRRGLDGARARRVRSVGRLCTARMFVHRTRATTSPPRPGFDAERARRVRSVGRLRREDVTPPRTLLPHPSARRPPTPPAARTAAARSRRGRRRTAATTTRRRAQRAATTISAAAAAEAACSAAAGSLRGSRPSTATSASCSRWRT